MKMLLLLFCSILLASGSPHAPSQGRRNACGVGCQQHATGSAQKSPRKISSNKGPPYWWEGPNNPFNSDCSRAPGGCANIVSGGIQKIGGRPQPHHHSSGSRGKPQQHSHSSASRGKPQQHSHSSASGGINLQGALGPMGICPANYVCLHWQLCKNGVAILDGSGIIDKSITVIPHNVKSSTESCGGDMICCSVPHGTHSGVGIHSHSVSGSRISDGKPSFGSHTSTVSRPSQGEKPSSRPHTTPAKRPSHVGKPLTTSHTSPGRHPSHGGKPSSTPHTSPGRRPSHGVKPSTAPHTSPGKRPSHGGKPSTGSYTTSGSRPSHGEKPSTSSGSRLSQSGKPSSRPHTSFGSHPSHSGKPSTGSDTSFGIHPPHGGKPSTAPHTSPGRRPSHGGKPSTGSYTTSGSHPSHGGKPSLGSHSSFSQSSHGSKFSTGTTTGASLSSDQFASSHQFSDNTKFSSGLSVSKTHPTLGLKVSPHSRFHTDGESDSSDEFAFSSFPDGTRRTSFSTGTHSVVMNVPIQRPSLSQDFKTTYSKFPTHDTKFSTGTHSASISHGSRLSSTSQFPSGSLSVPGSQTGQSGSNMPNMMGGMMMMITTLRGTQIMGGGSCSASSYCVPEEDCDPYTGFIIMNTNQVSAAFADSPVVPFIDCFVPAGGLQNGVCCALPHPLVGPDGKPID